MAARETAQHLFPRAALRRLRAHVTAHGGCLADVSDDVLVELLTTIFWAGLETYEGMHYPIGIVFLGTSDVDFVLPAGVESTGAPLYQWKVLRFEEPRPFAIDELVKLAVAGIGRRLYTAVKVRPGGGLVIAGLIREGFHSDSDPFVTIVASRPGCVSILNGGELLLELERGVVLSGGESAWFSAGPVRRALESMARTAGLDHDDVPGYLRAVRSVIANMIAHGRGGILVISDETQPEVIRTAAYHLRLDSSLASLLRLARRVGHATPARPESNLAFPTMLRNTFLAEADRVTQELGALTAIDGAVVVNGELALLAFGVILPVGHQKRLAEASDAEGLRAKPLDLASRGTRHRASAAWAAEHPGSVVVVSSTDGQLSCMHRQPGHELTLVWRFGALSGADQ